MSNTDVSSCVSAIIASFANGLDVLCRVREARTSSSRRRLKTARPKASKDVKTNLAKEEEEELQVRLSRSLRFGHEAISREYQGAYSLVGNGFAVGDATAQTRLAEVLLRLNTGLVGIITSFLSSDVKKQQQQQQKNLQPDYQRLTDISEQSRVETCQILSQLYQRITAAFRPKTTSKASRTLVQVKPEQSGKIAPPATQTSASRTKKLMQKSSQPLHQIAFVRPGRKKQRPLRPAASVSTPNLSMLSSSKTATTLPKAISTTNVPSTAISSNHTAKPAASRTKASSKVKEMRKRQSASNVTSPARTKNSKVHILPKQRPLNKAANSTPTLVQPTFPSSYPGPPLLEPPNLSPTSGQITTPSANAVATSIQPAAATQPPQPHHYHQPNRTGQRPQSFHSIAFSARTRLGEIPMSLWEEPWDFETMERLNREAMEAGWPLALPGESLIARPGAQGRKKRIGGGILKMFRRRE